MKQKKGQRTQVGGTEEGIKKRKWREQDERGEGAVFRGSHIKGRPTRGREEDVKEKDATGRGGKPHASIKAGGNKCFPRFPDIRISPLFLSLSLSENGATVTPSLYSS